MSGIFKFVILGAQRWQPKPVELLHFRRSIRPFRKFLVFIAIFHQDTFLQNVIITPEFIVALLVRRYSSRTLCVATRRALLVYQ